MKLFESKSNSKKRLSDESSSIADQLRENELFANVDIPDSDFDDLEIKTTAVKKGEILFRQGDLVNSIYLIIDGEINLIKKQSFGKTHYDLSRNNFFGHEELFLQSEAESVAIVIKDSLIAELSKEKLNDLFAKNPEILNNIKKSFQDLDSTRIKKFENAIKELSNILSNVQSEQLNDMTGDDYPSQNQTTFKAPSPETKSLNSKKSNLKKMTSEKTLINYINENLSLLEEEKDKLHAVISDYELENKKLQTEIEKLKKQHVKLISLDKEKTEILGRQSYRIIELEKETVKFEELESGFLKNIDYLNEQLSKDKIRIKKLETELTDRETTVSNLESEYKDNRKNLIDLNETHLILNQRITSQDELIKELTTKLKTADNRIEYLSAELLNKEGIASELNKELLNRTQQISSQNEFGTKAALELQELKKGLEAKEDAIRKLSENIRKLQDNLALENENVNSKEQQIRSQTQKITELESQLKDSQRIYSQKDADLNNYVNERNAYEGKLKQQEFAFEEQNKIIFNLKEEITSLKNNISALTAKENNLQQIITDLNTNLTRTNDEKNSFETRLKEEILKAEPKEKELIGLNNKLQQNNSKIDDLNDIVQKLKKELSETGTIKEKLNALNKELLSKTSAHERLLNENNTLQEKIKELNADIKKERSGVLDIEEQLNQLKVVEEKYKSKLVEKDKVISQQSEEIEKIKSSNIKEAKSSASEKNTLEKDLKKKEKEISNLTQKFNNLEKEFDEKSFIEEQQLETIENQAKKIVELELLINEFESKNKKKEISEDKPQLVNPQTQPTSESNIGMFSKTNLVKSKPIHQYSLDETLEHYRDFDVDVINVKVLRASIDIVTLFNEFLQEVINKQSKKIIVNLLFCEFIDSSILGSLVHNLKRVTALGGDLRLVGFHPSVKSMLELTRTHNIFDSYKSVEEAIDSFS